jgi:hypothetical protein
MGRPAMWEDPEAFAIKVEEYFETEKSPTWSGLALYMGFESRQSLEEYKKREGFTYPIKKALLRIELIYESNLQKQNPAGSIFALKNFGWQDKQEISQKTTITDQRIDESKLSDDDLRALTEIQRKSGAI